LGDYNRAQAVLDSLQPVPKERGEFYLVLALTQKASGKTDEAKKNLKDVLPLLVEHPEAHEQVSMLLFSQGMFREALPILQEAVLRFPKSETAWANLAQAELQMGELGKAHEHAEQALAVRETPEGHLVLADILEASRQPLAAIEHYQQAVKLDPSEANLIALGYELISHWNWKEAQEIFAFASAKFSGSWRVRLGLGAAYLGQDENEKATQYLLQAIELAPDVPLGYQLLAQGFGDSSGSFEHAVARFRTFYRTHPNNPWAAYYHVLALHRSSIRNSSVMDYEQGIRLLKAAIAQKPDFYDALFLLGEISFNQKNWKEAIAAYAQATKYNPAHLEAHYKLGLSLQRLGQTERAKAELKLYQELKEKQNQAMAERIAQTMKFIVSSRK
jgi:tetratricopeptide (TPR) repeat protein